MDSLFHNEKLESLIYKLNLEEFIKEFGAFFAREKSFILEGDPKVHIKYIKELEDIKLTLPKVNNLDEEIIKLSKGATLSLKELYEFIKIVEFFNSLKAKRVPPLIRKLVDSIEIPQKILDIVKYFNKEGLIDIAMDDELFRIKEAQSHIKRELKELLNSLISSKSLEEFLVDRKVHFFLGEEALLLRGGFSKVLKGNIIGKSSGGFFYVVPQKVASIKEREVLLEQKEELIYQRYAKEFSKIFKEHLPFLKFINKEFDKLDHYNARVLFAKAKDLNFFLPISKKVVELVDFLHPAIKKDPVPISINFNKNILLITGVNAGGKTMLLKSILSAALLSKYLIPFKASLKSKIGSFENIEAILDDPQEVKNDISTFAGRMVEFAKLFKISSALVGVDEIELGTDSDEAAALFRAILEELINRGFYFVITTHHKRLAQIMANDNRVQLVAAIYDEKNRVPTYRFLEGTIGKSYAFETALRYGISLDIIKRAKEFYGEDKERLNELIERSSTLEDQLRKKKEELDNLIKNLEDQKIKIQKEREKLYQEQKEKLSQLEAQYQKSLKYLKEAIKSKDIKEAHRLQNLAYKEKSKVDIKNQVKAKSNIEIKEGDIIEYRGKEGVVLSLKGREAYIELNGLKIRVKKEELKPLKKRVKKEMNKVSVNIQKPSKSAVSLKLIGLREDEAREKLLDFI
ncbi:MAG: endonuclease MutS2, partial [Epsilonproteobacteria bacterium]|nr:endonuclease MutS2 [Campylobacterota bacterium]